MVVPCAVPALVAAAAFAFMTAYNAESKSELACSANSRLEEWREQRAKPNASADGRVESIRDQRAMHEDEMPIVGGTP